MIDNIGHILYHVLIILFPILFYHQFIHKPHQELKKTNDKLVIVLIATLLLTMSFPVDFPHGFNYDFRLIPIIIAFTYVGILHGVILLAFMFLYSFILGENNILLTSMNYLIASSFLTFFKLKLDSVRLKIKIVIISIFFGVIVLTRGIAILHSNENQHFPYMLIISVITWITIVTVIYIIDNLLTQVKIQNELQRSEKLKVVSELAASVAHEVRNPLTTTRGFLQLMSKDTNLTANQKNYIDISLVELDRAQSIIQDYLSLAKPNKQDVQTINLSQELEKIIQLMSSYTTLNNVEIQSTILDPLFVKGNKDEIKQVFINIIKNGIEAVGVGGKITVNAFSSKYFVHVTIKDNGIGMSKKQISNLGTPFYSTKDKGTGVGLTISYQIIELMRGKIEVESDIGKGTTFTIKLPKCSLND
jgi:two-component system, sporulation sensor kinase B